MSSLQRRLLLGAINSELIAMVVASPGETDLFVRILGGKDIVCQTWRKEQARAAADPRVGTAPIDPGEFESNFSWNRR